MTKDRERKTKRPSDQQAIRPPDHPMHAELSIITLELLRQQLAGGGTARLRVSSNSMAPSIKAGDEVIVEAAKPAELRIGDVVVLNANGGLLMHRLLARQGKRLVTRGDSMAAPDRPWTPEQLLGRVRTVLRADGRQIELRLDCAPMALRFLWQGELLAYRLARAVKRWLLGERPSRWSAIVAWLITIPSRYWLCHRSQRIVKRISG